jgi:putative tryptophan/tyrosine transport system substrate-binding protein
VRRLGILNGYDGSDPLFQSNVAETLKALSQLGWESRRNLEVIERWTDRDIHLAAVMAKELVALQPDVIFANGPTVAEALQMETRVIPIVFLARDPVGFDLVASLARPGGNLTGISNSENTIAGKMLSLLKSAAPGIRQASIMFNPDSAGRSGGVSR